MDTNIAIPASIFAFAAPAWQAVFGRGPVIILHDEGSHVDPHVEIDGIALYPVPVTLSTIAGERVVAGWGVGIPTTSGGTYDTPPDFDILPDSEHPALLSALVRVAELVTRRTAHEALFADSVTSTLPF